MFFILCLICFLKRKHAFVIEIFSISRLIRQIDRVKCIKYSKYSLYLANEINFYLDTIPLVTFIKM